MNRLVLLLLGLLPQDPESDRLLKELENAESTVRLEAFEKLSANTDPKVSANLKKAVPALFDQWSKKAAAERTRVLKDLLAARKKSFNAASFASKQKETLKLLKADTIERMETSVRDLWEQYYINPFKADEDEKVGDATNRAQELARFIDRLEGKEKTVTEDKFKESQRLLDENYILQSMSDRDQKTMTENGKLRAQVPEEEYRNVWHTNLYRVLMGKNALRLHPKLCIAARDHSKDMKEKDFFDHDSPVPGKRTMADRAKRQGAKAHGENIARGITTGESAFWDWFRSFEHHENMLEPYVEMGAGTYEGFWTQMFAK